MKLAQLLGLFLVALSFTAIEGLSFFSRCRIVPDNTTSCLNSTGFSCRNEKYLKVLDSKPFPKKRWIECQAASFYGVTPILKITRQSVSFLLKTIRCSRKCHPIREILKRDYNFLSEVNSDSFLWTSFVSFWSWLGYLCPFKTGHRPLSLKVPYIEFEIDVKFLTLLQPCKQYIKILFRITYLHTIIRPRWNFWCFCHN